MRETLGQFERAKNFGSLIVPKLRGPAEALRVVEAREFDSDLLLKEVQERVIAVLRMAEGLSPKYHVVVANPPYMGGKGMNRPLGDFAKTVYPNSKADLFGMFMERCLSLSLGNGSMATINMQSWMFLSSFAKLRSNLVSNTTLLTMAHLGKRAFDSIGGAVVSTTAFVIRNARDKDQRGDYFRLTEGTSEKQKSDALLKAINTAESGYHFSTPISDFEKIPGMPIAYWLSDASRDAFVKFDKLSSISTSAVGQNTGDNDRFLKYWYEISGIRVDFSCCSRDATYCDRVRWYPYNKGGGYRKWYGTSNT